MDFQLPLPLNYHLGTLAVGLGCCPLDHGPYHPQSVCQILLIGIRSLVRFGKDRSPLVHPVLYPRWYSSDALPK
jgi:hypothetical protein